MKDVNTSSLHDLYTSEIKFNVFDCSGIYYIKRLNEFGDAVLMVMINKNEYKNAGTIEARRRNEITVIRRVDGMTFEKRIKLSLITPIQ